MASVAARALAAALGLRHFCGGRSDRIGGIGGTLRPALLGLYNENIFFHYIRAMEGALNVFPCGSGIFSEVSAQNLTQTLDLERTLLVVHRPRQRKAAVTAGAASIRPDLALMSCVQFRTERSAV